MGWQTAIQSSILLTQSTPFNLDAFQTVPFSIVGPSGTQVFGPMQVNQTGYEIAFSLGTGSGTSVPFCQFEMLWTDSATGNVVSIEHWNVAAGTNPGSISYFGTGPTKGDTLTVTLSWFAAGGAILTVKNLSIAQTARTFLRDDWRSNLGQGAGSVPGFTNGTYDLPANVVLSTAPTIGATSNTTRILPLYSGLVQAAWVPGPGSTGCHFVVQQEADQSGLTAQTIWQNQNTNNPSNPVFTLPRSVCSITFFNANGSSNQVSLVLIAQEQPP